MEQDLDSPSELIEEIEQLLEYERIDGNLKENLEYSKELLSDQSDRQLKLITIWWVRSHLAKAYESLAGYQELAKQHWLKIPPIEGYFSFIYFNAQWGLAKIYAKENNEEKFNEHVTKLTEVEQEDLYLQNVLKNIINTNISLSKKWILMEILMCYLAIRDDLQVVTEGTNNASHERTFCHYTEANTALHLLQEEGGWPFRMSSTEQCNDPSEGKVLFQFLNNYSESLRLQETNKGKSSELAVFIGCFAFNHDSLNHFRLYGKARNREATGVSVVFQSGFFNTSHAGIMSRDEIENMKEQLATDASVKNGFGIPSIGNASAQGKSHARGNKSPKYLSKLPLYRCIYLDPESFMKGDKDGESEKIPYLKVAARDELTFYRENDRIVEDFEEYKKDIADVQKNVSEEFKIMIGKIEQLFNKGIKGSEENGKLLDMLNLILLPLKYLVKHSAYHEEQECRILYCCPFVDDGVDSDPSSDVLVPQKLYRTYRQIIKNEDVVRIYLSEGAKGSATAFKRLGVKDVRMSANPFRMIEKVEEK